MKPTKQQKRTKLTRFLMKVILVTVSTALIVYFMPTGDEFGYQYELDRPWNYGLLIANTKFPFSRMIPPSTRSERQRCGSSSPTTDVRGL